MSCIIGYQNYQRELNQQLEQILQKKRSVFIDLSEDLQQVFNQLRHTARLLDASFELGHESIEINQEIIPPIYKIELANTKHVEINSSYTGLLQQFGELFTAVFSSMVDDSTIANIAILERDGLIYNYTSSSDNISSQIPIWIENNKESIKRAKIEQQALYLPPVYNKDKTEALYYVLMPLYTSNDKNTYLTIELSSKALTKQLNEQLTSSFIVWHRASETTFLTNLGSPIQKTLQASLFSATDYLSDVLPPSQLNYVRTTTGHKFRQLMFSSATHDSDNDVKFILPIESSPFLAMVEVTEPFVIQKAWENAFFDTLSFSLLAALVLGSILFYVYHSLARPTSKLIHYIEKYSSSNDLKDIKVPRGWQEWFNKIKSAITSGESENKQLKEANQQLKIIMANKSQELEEQNASQDRNQALNRSIMNSIPDMLYYKNLDGSYLGCNSAYENFIGLSEASLVTKSTEDIFPEEIAEELTKFDFQALKSKRAFSDTLPVTFANGRKSIVRWVTAPIISNNGNVVGLLGLGRDVTKQEEGIKKLQQTQLQLERADQAKSDFIANMSHEIRTPMNAVIGMLEMLASSKLNPVQYSYLNVASTSSKHLLSVINDILDFSKLAAEQVTLHHEVFSIKEVLDIAFANSLPAAIEKGLLLDIDTPADFPEFFIGDKIRLNQIFTNLISNAVKFTAEGSIILKATILRGLGNKLKIEFCIIDTGVGIPEDKQASIFEAFTQSDASITREYGGTGLGLTIVSQLAKLMGGTTLLKSEPGKGSRFSVQLTLETREEQPEYSSVSRKWLIFEPIERYRSLLTNKLENANQQSRAISDISNVELFNNEILVCRPTLLNQLMKSELTKLQSLQCHYQPIAFDLTDVDSEIMTSLDHYPLLTMPFSTNAIMFNQFQHEVKPSAQAAMFGALKDQKILIVEDNEVNQQVLSLILSQEGASVIVTSNGYEGLTQLNKQKIDAVILDVQMPIMDGLACCRKIRELKKYQKTPVIAMTAHTSEEDKEKSEQAGFSVHLNKPIERKLLINSLVTLLDIKPPHEANVSLGQHLQHEQLVPLSTSLDLDFLMQQFNQDSDTVMKVLQKFYQRKMQNLSIEQQKYATADVKEVIAFVHNMKGMLGSVGAKQAYQATCHLEEQLKLQQQVDEKLLQLWFEQLMQLAQQLKQIAN